MSQHQPKTDLLHFLNLAAAQLRHRIKETESQEAYSSRINQLRMLEELIREQTPSGGRNVRTDGQTEQEAFR